MENIKDKQLTVMIPENLFCKVKASAAFRNMKLKNLVTEILYIHIQKSEEREGLNKGENEKAHNQSK